MNTWRFSFKCLLAFSLFWLVYQLRIQGFNLLILLKKRVQYIKRDCNNSSQMNVFIKENDGPGSRVSNSIAVPSPIGLK